MAYKVRIPGQDAKSIDRLLFPQKTGDTGDSGDRESRSEPYSNQADQYVGQREFRSPTEDIDLALKIGSYVERLPTHQSATACEIAEAVHGPGYTRGEVAAILRICEELCGARILIRGGRGYDYQLGGCR